ncbi:MAG: tRNA adenosine(34) deaminase TadA [Deltaproteobacteria bacterium]
MELALIEAEKAAKRGEVPVGAVLVDPAGTVLAADGNRNIELSDPTAHAEILVLRQAARLLGNYRLTGTVLYVTLESCAMCAGALVHARVRRVVFGASDPKSGALSSRYAIGTDDRLNHRIEVDGGLLASRCAAKLQSFFRMKRGKTSDHNEQCQWEKAGG